MTARGSTILLRTGLNAFGHDEVHASLTSQLRLCSRMHTLRGITRSASCLVKSPSTNHVLSEPTSQPQHRLPVHTHNQPVYTHSPCHRCYSSGTVANTSGRVSLFTKVKHAMGLKGKRLRYSGMKMTSAAFKLFRSCGEFIDYEEFFEVFDMPDTFNSWFLVMELHIWLCMVRLAAEGEDGKYVRNRLVETMWKDVESRIKMIGKDASPSYRRKSLDSLAAHFHFSLYAYDEGLLSDDRVLAGAVWRVLLEKRDADPRSLALMVQYIRQQVQMLDNVDSEKLLSKGDVTFLPLPVEKDNLLKAKVDRTV